MGACASCLGLDRHPSQNKKAEIEPLVSAQQQQYGTVETGDAGQPDEEELRREREELEQITVEATENMVDASQPGTSELSQHLTHARPTRQFEAAAADGTSEVEEEEEEAAWLESVQAAGVDDVKAVDALRSGDLVLDISQLRDAPAATTSNAQRSLKGKLPA
ncbi:hypothetical protein LTR09_008240 [Extremus antarcticus]|uniref:Uncharacterized protein n=1 Tax=Extremus antarcticus TaxID=702011 RepID=A0AAJ0DIK3_9PEZI|nr:hypothetical protein LTR09_008240 [Extremus antarcticus]